MARWTMLLTDVQRSVMRDYYDELMPDECTISRRTNTQDSTGQPVATWTAYATGVQCGFETSPFKFRAREIVAGGEGTAEILVRARLPLSYYDTIDQEDRLILTKRHAGTLTVGETYEIQGFVERGMAGLIVNLKRVEP